MTPRLLGQTCKFFTTLLSRNSQKRLEHKENQTKYRKMTRKPPRVMLDVPYYFSLNCVNNKIRESDWFSVSFTDRLIWLRQHQNCPILTFRLDACDQTCQIGQLKSQWKSSIKCCQPIRINKLVHASKSKPTKKLQWTILPASFWHIRFF